MSFWDELGGLFSEASDLRDELTSIKDDFISSIVDPAQDLTSTVDDIASEIKKN